MNQMNTFTCNGEIIFHHLSLFYTFIVLRRITLTHGYPSVLSWTSASLWRSRVRWTSSSTNWLTSSWRLTRMIHRLCCWSKEYRYASLSSLVSPEEVERSWKVGQVKWIIFTSWKTWKYCAQLSLNIYMILDLGNSMCTVSASHSLE